MGCKRESIDGQCPVLNMECDVLSEGCEVWNARPCKVRRAICGVCNVRY